MSLNTCHAGNGVVLYSGEFILLYCDGVTLTFECHEPNMKGSKKGRIYLTTHRMIFRSNGESKGLISFSFPFHTIHNLGLEQPVFGANLIKGLVKSEPNGGWTGEAGFKMTFKNGGAIEYGQALMAAGSAASRYMGQQPPPPYSAPTSSYVNATTYMAPTGGAPYGFHVPTNVFPEQPPANQVYMYEQPPPYPGVMGMPQQTAYVAPNGAAYAQPPMQYPGQMPPAYGASAPAANYPQQQAFGGYPQQQMGPPPAYSAHYAAESKKAV